LYVDAATFGARFGAPSHGPSSEQDAEFAAWLSEQENRYVTIILEAEAQLTEWTRRAIGQADRVLLVAWSGDNPEVCTLEREVQDRGLLAHQDLVLLHPVETVQPVGTDAWLAGRRLSGHHHLRLGNAVDEGRLARRVTGNGNGLVLGGGGARGLAHVGVIHAIEEAEIPVDMVGGTSIGALVGAAYALKGSYADMLPLADAFASPSRIFDRTLPLTSLMKGAKILDLLRELYGDVCIEDLWGPYFAVSTNLSRARMEVHTTGPLWLAVRKSMSIPAIFPPMQQDGDVIVDGGVVNNFPVDVMREYSDFGTVIGVNVAPATDKVKSYNFGDSVSGWRILWSRVNPMARKIKAPALIGSILRTQEINSVMRLRDSLHNVDLLIEPPVDGFRLNEYEAHRQLDQVGYEAARQAISLWRSESQAEAVQKG
jgi:predicted acylesterase/phospholipase RssA